MSSIVKARLFAMTVGVAEEVEGRGPLDLVAYEARVSNPNNQPNFATAGKLLKYLANQGHWSPSDMADVTFEIDAPRDITRQILRHWSMRVQEFSQRYALANSFVLREARMQDEKNRQNSLPCADPVLAEQWADVQNAVLATAIEGYTWATRNGIAKECARVVLPEGNTMSRLYLKGSLRSFMFYLKQRLHESTQLEHRWVANAINDELNRVLPSWDDVMEIIL